MPVRWPAPYESRAEAGPAIPADFRRNGGALQPGAEAHGEPGGTWTKEHDQKPDGGDPQGRLVPADGGGDPPEDGRGVENSCQR